MNTYEVTALRDVPEQYRSLVKEEVLAAFEEGLLVSVQLQDIDYGDEDSETQLYGVYTKTPEEVDNYNQSGGLWGYSSSFEMDC